MILSATAKSHPNLALVKYWGKANSEINLPANGSISVNLDGASTVTTVAFSDSFKEDRFTLNGKEVFGPPCQRVSRHLDRVRCLAGFDLRARVESKNDFPSDMGMASSSSGFAALTVAAAKAAGLHLDQKTMSMLARKGSGSACRSIPSGFAEWIKGSKDEESYAVQLAPPDHWDLRITSVIFQDRPKQVSSTNGHASAERSPLFDVRLSLLPGTLRIVRSSLLARDLNTFGMAVEREAIMMHAVAMTSVPDLQSHLSGIFFWQPSTMRIIQAVQQWRSQGLAVFFTIDAGACVHLITGASFQEAMARELEALTGPCSASVLVSSPGHGARLI